MLCFQCIEVVIYYGDSIEQSLFAEKIRACLQELEAHVLDSDLELNSSFESEDNTDRRM